jgi:hypothetical protein
MVDVLSRMMQKVAGVGLIKGLASDLVTRGVINLQYADDSILFLENDVAYARNLKYILTCFELMSGMRINYNKSELVPINIDNQEDINSFVGFLGVLWGLFPLNI